MEIIEFEVSLNSRYILVPTSVLALYVEQFNPEVLLPYLLIVLK